MTNMWGEEAIQALIYINRQEICVGACHPNFSLVKAEEMASIQVENQDRIDGVKFENLEQLEDYQDEK